MTEYLLNLFDPAVQSDPYGSYAEMRELGSVLWNPLMSAWMVWPYDDVLGILKDPDTYSSATMRQRGLEQARARGETEDNFGAPTMLNSDPPDHDRYRGVVARAFTPRAVTAQEPTLRRLAQELVQPLSRGDSVEIVRLLSSPLPVLAIAAMLGVENTDIDSFREWSDAFVTAGDLPTEEEVVRSRDASSSLRAYFDAEIGRRRGGGGGDDLLARLVEANEGGVLDDAELLASCVLLLVAGNETTTNLIGNGALALMHNPAQLEMLRREPAMLPRAIEEMLRYDGPVQSTARFPKSAVKLVDAEIPAGSIVVVVIAAANRDPAQFPDPERFDITRDPNDHLAFGEGIHFCIGAPLARMEANIAFSAMFERFARLRLRDPDAKLNYKGSYFLRGLDSLKVALD